MAIHTRNAIKRAFAELAVERPVEKITVRDITARGQVSRNTFYYYFRDVYDVLEEYLDDITQRLIAQVSESLEAGLSLEEAGQRAIGKLMAHRELFVCMYQSSKKEELIRCPGRSEKTLLNYFIEVVAKDIPASRSDKELVAAFYVNGMRGLVLQSIDGSLNRPLAEAFARITQLVGIETVRVALQRAAEYPEET